MSMNAMDQRVTDTNKECGTIDNVTGVCDISNFPSHVNILKPQIDQIFSEVHKSLPSIDFDSSDISSDGDEPIFFHQNLKLSELTSVLDDDKDLDTSLSQGDDSPRSRSALEELPSKVNGKNKNVSASNEAENEDNVEELYDNDLSAFRSKTTFPTDEEIKKWQILAQGMDNAQAELDMREEADLKRSLKLGHISKATSVLDNSVPCRSAYTSSGLESRENKERKKVNFDNQTSNFDNKINAVSTEDNSLEMNIDVNNTDSKNHFSEIIHKFHNRLQDGIRFMDSTERRKKFTEQFQTKDEEIISKFTLLEPTTLSRRLFEELDLDSVLNAANEENVHMQGQHFSSHIQKSHNGGGDKKADTDTSEELTLIQKLAQLSALQSGADVSSIRSLDPQTGATRKDSEVISISLPSAEMACQTQGTATSCTGTSTDSGIGKAKILYGRLTHEKRDPEPPTVFIDLRGFECQKEEERQGLANVQRVLGIKTGQCKEESSSDDDEEMVERCDWRLTRQKIKQDLSSHGASATFFHLEKQANENPLPKLNYKTPPRVISLKEHASSKDWTTSSNTKSSALERTNNKEEDNRIKMERLDKEREKERQRKEAMRLREEREKEQEQKMRMSKHIEAGRSLATTQGRQSAGENTPIIFDIEVSYEPAPTTLPTNLSSETLLLTVHLSSNGEIVQHRNRPNCSVDTEEGLSATYNALLSWLLSLVPQELTSLGSYTSTTDHTVVSGPMFHVVGLQQLWFEEELRLFVVVAPSETFHSEIGGYSRPKKGKQKDEMKGSSKFAQHITKFLSVNTLYTVCPWLSTLVPVEVRNEWPEDKDAPQFSYSPPLPKISTKPLSTFVQINPDPLAANKIFSIPVGFVWQTVDNDEGCCQADSPDNNVCYETQNTMSLIYKNIFHNPVSLMAILSRVSQEGLDLAGIRLLYPCPELLKLQTSDVSPSSDHDTLNNIGPVLALALRGTFARTIWLDAVGPSDPQLARRTDPNSLCALFGGDNRDNVLLFCPRNPSRVQNELTRWFGGRIPKGASSVDIGFPYLKKEEGRGKRGKKSNSAIDLKYMPIQRPPAALTATCKADIFLVLSPLVPASFFGVLLAISQRRGYHIQGVKRQLLTTKLAGSLGISSNVQPFFCPGVQLNELCKDRSAEAIAPSTIFLLRKENAAHNMQSLIEAFMIQLTMAGRLGCVQMRINESLTSKHLFHTTLYSGSLLSLLGGSFSKVPEFDLSHLRLSSSISESVSKDLEQIAVVIMLGHDLLKMCGMFVAKILNVLPYSKTPVQAVMTESFELLGLKWIPQLSMHQAKEVTPYEVGDKLWRQSVHLLMSEPALVLVLRGVNIFNVLKPLVRLQQTGCASVKAGQDRKASLLTLKKQTIECLMSHNPRESDVFTRLFFYQNELYPDPLSRSLLPYLPESKLYFNILETQEARHTIRIFSLKPLQELDLTQESIMDEMITGQQTITTVLLIKPRAVQKYLQKILRKIVQDQFVIVGLRLLMLSSDMVDSFIPLAQKKNNTSHQQHIDALTSGPVLALALQHQNAVKRLCDLLGPEDPVIARCQSQFLWRGEFGCDICNNGLYCSTSYIDAVRDLKLLFPDGVCCGASDLLTVEEIRTLAEDSIIDINASVNRNVTLTCQTQQDGQPFEVKVEDVHHLLLQTTCVILTPTLMTMSTRSKTVHGVDLLTSFLNNGFALVGSRLVWLTNKQAESLLHVVGGGSFEQVTFLCSGPCLVLAMQRENAVLAFDSILAQHEDSHLLMKKYGYLIIHPNSIKQSHALLAFFFDRLVPGSQLAINCGSSESGNGSDLHKQPDSPGS